LKILEHRALRGPNYYSRYVAIFMRLDIGELENRPSDQVPGIVDRFTELLPTLYEHRCSIGEKGGFLERVQRGTWAGHCVEHVAIELQNLIGFSVGYGKTVDSYEPGIYNIVYRYRDEACGLAAGVEAVDIVERVFNGREVDLEPVIDRLKAIRDANMLGPSTASIVEAAKRRDIPYQRLTEDSSYVQLGHGHLQERIQATVTGRSSLIGYGIADDKNWTKQILGDAGIPVPQGQVCYAFEEALDAARYIGYPVVVKPLVGNHGRGVTTDINDDAGLKEAYDAAYYRNETVVVERFVRGEDHRLLVVDGKLVAAARRRPAHVVGDGKSTLKELIDRENQDPRRGVGHENLLTQIVVDEQTQRLIGQQGLTLESVIADDQIIFLKSTANLRTGGTDLLAETLSRPLEEQSAAVVEVNAGPGFRMHLSPTHGQGREVGARVVDMLFPGGGNGRVPISAITGTNGKTTTVRLLSHMLRHAGRNVGMACTGTIEIDNHVVMRGDYSGPQAASIVLREPTVEQAVLEVARGGIMRRGLGFDECDVGVMLNVASDHLGERDIHTLDELARCKSVVIDAVRKGGTAVLNADDERCLEAQEWARGDVVFFSLDPSSRTIRHHVHNHGVAFTVHKGNIVMRQGQVQAEIIPVVDVPITFDGHASFNIANALAAAAAAHGLGLSAADIQMGLQTFYPTAGQNPGRTNLIEADGVNVLIDYGHNVPALKALAELVGSFTANRRISVASAPGNRRDEDLKALGAQLAAMHDELFICEPDPRGRPVGEAAGLLRQGAESAKSPCEVSLVLDEHDAVEQAMDRAAAGDLLVLLIDDIDSAIERLKGRRFRTDAAKVAAEAQ